MIYTVTLNPSLDYTVNVENFKPGMLNRSTQQSLSEGGKGINVACVLNELGIKVKALGFAAGFTGEEIVQRIKKRNIENMFFVLNNGISRINIKIKGKNETEINGSGPEINHLDFEKLIKEFACLENNDMAVLSGSIGNGIKNPYDKLCAVLDDKKVPFVVDTEGEELLRTLKYRPFLIKPNKKELEDIFETKIDTDEGIIAYGKKLQQHKSGGAQNVLISMGKSGAVLLASDGRVLKRNAPKGNAINTVGSGDSMVAGFLGGLKLYNDTEKAFKLSVAAGSACAFSQGLPTVEKITELFNTMK